MTGHTKARLALVAGVMAAVLGGAGLAWACTAQSRITTMDPESGDTGTMVTLSGEGFQSGPVEIRWDSQTGPVIGMADARPGRVEGAVGASFTTSVSIPDAAPGQHLLVAVPGGTLFYAPKAFVVTAPTVEPRDPKTPPPGDSPGEPPSREPVPSEPVPGEPVPSEPAPVDPVPSPATDPGSDAAAPVVVTPPAPSVRQSEGVQPAPAANRSAALPPPSSEPPAADERPPPATSTDPAPAEQVSGDLWSGFASGDVSLAPSLVDGRMASDGPTSGLAIGVALLVAGLVALVAAVGASVMTRRRARAGSAA